MIQLVLIGSRAGGEGPRSSSAHPANRESSMPSPIDVEPPMVIWCVTRGEKNGDLVECGREKVGEGEGARGANASRQWERANTEC